MSEANFSIPITRSKKDDYVVIVFLVIFALRRVLLLRSDIRLSAEWYSLCECWWRIEYHCDEVTISLLRKQKYHAEQSEAYHKKWKNNFLQSYFPHNGFVSLPLCFGLLLVFQTHFCICCFLLIYQGFSGFFGISTALRIFVFYTKIYEKV